ncbi:leucine-rich repeat-containing 74A [Brachionus plicatilis]|uniref:Leucine-rich repeat-containing 74A n=1 Tax=Brachionus plicatilis TaxID=10195 RepID=A0A3M7P9T1_BRAPC|nr:leucine-rich repeat-containing 74A [Brachionus plicatilis]
MSNNMDIKKPKSKTQQPSNKSSNTAESVHTDDLMSSVSNTDAVGRKIDASQANNLAIINMKRKNLNYHGAYLLSQRIKQDFSIIQVIDLSDNQLEDEGILYLSIPFRLCTKLNSLNLSNNSITEYGVRVLLENLSFRRLKYLNLSGNLIGNKGVEHLSKYLPSVQIEHLALNSTGIEEEGAKAIGFSLMSSNWLKIIELSWNNFKSNGSVVLSRGLMGNNSVEEIYLSYNSNFGYDGIVAMAECLKINKNLKLIDLTNIRINFEGAKAISQGLKANSTLKSLNVELSLSYNNVTSSGIYEILKSINTETSGLEYLGLKNVPMQKHLVLIVELIQQRRKFSCDYGSMILYPETSDDESMIRLARYLGEKRMRLIDMFRVLDKNNKLEMNKTEFIRRMKLFEPRLTQKDLHIIAKNLSTKDTIYYSSLFTQMTKPKPDNLFEINRKKAQLNEEEDRFLNKFNKSQNFKKIVEENRSTSKISEKNETKFKEIKNWLESQDVASNGSDLLYENEKDFKKDEKIVQLKLPDIKTDKIGYADKRFSRSDSSFTKKSKENKEAKSLSRLSMKSNSNTNGRFSSQSHYLKKSKKKMDNSSENINEQKFKQIEKIEESLSLSNENKATNLQSLETG